MSPRRYDPAATGEAVIAQARLVWDWLVGRRDGWDTDVLPGWTLSVLVVHLTGSLRTITAAQPSPDRPMTIADYLSRLAPAAAEISSRDISAALGHEPAELLRRYQRQLDATVAAIAAIEANPVIGAPRGPIRIGDFLATRALELVTHTDDAVRAFPADPPRVDRAALAMVVRTLADTLATIAPGHSVEVRVPPYAAVQCVAGPRHTRGTPPSVVETDPMTFLRLVTGREEFAAALGSGSLVASGERSNLADHLPLLR